MSVDRTAGQGALGIIAGNGQLPAMIADGARRRGRRVVVAALKGEASDGLRQSADHFAEVPIGNLGAIVELFRAFGAAEAVMAGGVTKRRLFGRLRPDWLAARLLLRLRHFKDDAALRAIAELLQEQGVRIVDASAFVPEALAPAGVLGKRRPTAAEQADIEFGFGVLADLAPVDVGQTVVVRGGSILAIEAIEGTDACIRRGAELGRGRSRIARGGVVVCKGLKPGQDRRFDLPAIGLRTIEVCAAVGVQVLAIEAGGTLMLDRATLVRAASRARLSLVGVERGGGGTRHAR
ncbi:MAG: UDP-2,3-diacylglucosamine diphosphatase LpxI [Deltaproteobacteria bacterium]|nr:UDP-2,3-diacylglucosamine diphosphatase LpxI [Deltaproteobacteria bacterium]